MSDITVLFFAINKMTGLITFHCQDYVWFGKDNVRCLLKLLGTPYYFQKGFIQILYSGTQCWNNIIK